MNIDKLEFHDATIKPMPYPRGFAEGPMTAEPYNQRITLSEDQLPDIKGWETGEEYILVLKVRQTGNNLQSRSGENPDDPKHLSADFDIEEVAGYYDSDKESATA